MDLKKLSPSKINPTKLLGGSSFANKSANIGDKLKEDSITISASDLSTIKGQVFEIKNLVTNLTTLKKKKLTTERKETEREKFGEREKELEKKKKPEDNKIKLPQAPKLGFLDIVKRFVVNTLIGFVAVRLIKHLPKMMGVVKFIGGAMDFITDFGGKLLNGLATFVQKGYEAYDFTRKTLKSFGGDNALKLFDGFNDALGGIVTAALAASFALFDMAGGSKDDKGEVKIRGKGTGRSRRGIDPEIAKRYAQRYGKDAAVSKFGRSGVSSLGGKYARSGAENLARKGLVSLVGKSGAKAVLKFTRPLLKRLPIIGAILDFGLSVALGEDPGRAAFKAIGAGLLGTIGAALGGPFALLTGLAGGAIGDAAGAALYDVFFSNKKPNQKVAKAAGGGQPVTRGGRLVSSPRRTITKSKVKRQIAVQPTQLKPGADIGGEEKIEKVFPKSKDKDQVSPLDYIEKSYKNTNQDKFFGSLLNLQTKSLVGQKPSKVDYTNAAQGLSNWMTITFSDEILRTGAVYAAGGGEINADMLSKKSGDMTDAIAKSLKGSISKRLDANIDDLMKQMMLKQPVKEPDKTDPTIPTDDEILPGGLTEGQWGPLLDLIAGKESGGNYEAMYPSTTLPGATKMTIAEVARRATGAVGKYQQLPRYLVGRAKAAGLDPNKDLYSPENQERIIINVNIKGRGGEKWLRGEISDEQFMQGLSQEFASLPNAQGKFYYPGQRSAMTPEKVKAALSKVKKGGYSQQELALSKEGISTGKFKVIEYITGDRNHPNLDIGGHGMPSNYHDHIAFASIQEKERAKRALRSAGIKIGSELRPGDPGFHGRNLAIDIPGYQWGGTGSIGSKEFEGSRKVRSVLGIGNVAPRFHGGFIPKDAKYFLHKGEYVVDADSVNTIGKDFIATINSIENTTQLKQKVGSLINHLSYIAEYEPGGQQEIVVEMPEPEVVTMPMPIPVGGGGMVMVGSGSGEDYSQELYSHA